MERQAELAGRIVGADGAAAERWVADDEVVSLGDARLGEVLGANARVRMEELRDPSRDRVHFDAGQRRLGLASASGMRAKKRPVPHPGSSTRPPEKPMRRRARQIPLPMNSGVKCAYWVTRARLASSPGETSCSRSSPRVLPALREGVLGGSAKDIVRKVARAEGREEREAFLLFRSRVPRLLLDLKHQPDGGDVVRRARLPVGGEAAGGGEAEVAAGTTTGAGASSSVSATASSPGSPKARPE